MKRKLLIFIGILAFIFPFLFSKNTFADEKDIYISRVYATDGKEFVEIFNKDKDRNFKDLSLRNTQKQTEIANIQNGILKANNYITIAQQSEDSDIKFKEEFRNIDTIGQQPILGLYIDGELKSYICSDEKRCIKGYLKNSTDLKPTNKGVEKIAVAREEILKNGGKMSKIENDKNYDFGLRNFDEYKAKFGGLLKVEDDQGKSDENNPINNNYEESEKEKEEISEEIPKTLKEDKSENNNETPVENRYSLSVDKKQEKLNTSEEKNKDKKESKISLISKESVILAPNTGQNKKDIFVAKFIICVLFFINYQISKRIYNEII